ncbi:MAG TPA: cation diffusion facilitator family transporter [Gammaproteobacteria bacterium]
MPSGADRDIQVRRIILIEGAANLVVLFAKLFVGLATGSLAVLGDAIHSLTDVANNVVAWVVIRMSAKPADREHPYGHRKFEGLAVFVLATLLAVLAVELGIHALRREADGPSMQPWTLPLMLSVLAINITLSIWQRYWARRLDSTILLADANHTFSDVLTTVVVILGWQLSARGFLWLDTLCALGVSAFVLYLAFSLFKRVTPVLLDEMAVAPEMLSATIAAVPGVDDVRRVRSRWIGSASAVDVIITVAPTMSTTESHRVAEAVESAVEAEFGARDITVHVEPSSANCVDRGA